MRINLEQYEAGIVEKQITAEKERMRLIKESPKEIAAKYSAIGKCEKILAEAGVPASIVAVIKNEEEKCALSFIHTISKVFQIDKVLYDKDEREKFNKFSTMLEYGIVDYIINTELFQLIKQDKAENPFDVYAANVYRKMMDTHMPIQGPLMENGNFYEQA